MAKIYDFHEYDLRENVALRLYVAELISYIRIVKIKVKWSNNLDKSLFD